LVKCHAVAGAPNAKNRRWPIRRPPITDSIRRQGKIEWLHVRHDGPFPVDAVVNRSELAMPPSVTLEMAKGLTLYLVKAVMSGPGDEVIDLARSNLWR
jgi:hypothetical protein